MAKPKLSRDEAEEYTKNLGQSVLGDYGLMEFAMHTLEVPKALGLSNEDWVHQRLGGFVRQTEAQRQEAVEELSGQKSEAGRYERAASQIAEILGISEATVQRDREAIEAKRSRERKQKPRELPKQARERLSTDARREEVAGMAEAGWSNAEIAVELEVPVATVQKDRAALRKQEARPSDKLRGAQAEKKANMPSKAEQKARGAQLDEDLRKPTMQALLQAPDSAIEEAIEMTERFIEEGVEMPNYDATVKLYGELGNELIVYGATHNLDASDVEASRKKVEDR